MDIFYDFKEKYSCLYNKAKNCLIQALYALSQSYVLNEKGSLHRLCRLLGVWLPPALPVT